ncbi:hypothetical protein IP70_22160 [alpha proteobacterium AAP38]|nr:hypothetical protein IP70_22160 [alpha proteobacterium AAP38]
MPANSNDRRRLPAGQTALTPAERQTRRREKLRQEEQDRWWAAEQECRAAEDAVEQADMASEAAWGPVNAIAERIAQELKAITDAVDLAATGGQLDAHVLAQRQ